MGRLNKKASTALLLLASLTSGSALAQSNTDAAAAFTQLATEFGLYLTAGFLLLSAVMVGFIGLKWLRMFANKAT